MSDYNKIEETEAYMIKMEVFREMETYRLFLIGLDEEYNNR